MSPKQLPDVTNIGHNYPEVISDGLPDLARVIKSTKMWKSLLGLFCQGPKPTHKNVPMSLLQISI